MTIVDPPSPFAPIAELKEFEKEMTEAVRLHPEDIVLKEALFAVRIMIEERLGERG